MKAIILLLLSIAISGCIELKHCRPNVKTRLSERAPDRPREIEALNIQLKCRF